ncbi:hypothetical protein DL96DRAFT_235362 [Flagelloscypha sp. PMI_526]|nr:hypothetical protein DL96DRAFT_235362 [Flagelloscypha sp. PMI_526]
MRHVTIVLTPDFGRKFILACPALKGLRLTGSRSLSLPEIPSTRRPILQSLRTAVNIWNSLPNPASLPFDISQLVSFGLYGVPLIQESWIRSFLAAAPYLQELGYSPSGFDENYLSKVTALPLSHTKSLCTIVLFAEGRVPLLFLNQFLSTSVPPPSLKNLSILLPYGPEYMSALGKIDEHLSSRPWINVPNISILLCASVRTRNDQRVSQALRRTLGQREIVIQWMPTLGRWKSLLGIVD